MTTTPTAYLRPGGRLVQGSVHETKDSEDNNGNKKIGKDGKPRQECFFAIAVPKTPGVSDWKQEAWAQPIVSIAMGAFPGGQHAWPSFAWKVTDGDSNAPNKKGKLPKDTQGFPGNWVVKLGGGFLPQLLTRNGDQRLPAEQRVELGDYVQVACTVAGNGRTDSPGVYINHQAVAFVGYGPRIVVERDYSNVGFGKGPVPQGVMATPPAGMTAAPLPATSAPVAAPVAAPAAAVPANPAILQAPAAPAPMPPAPPAAPVRQMTAAATATYEAYIASGWTDALLVQHGLMVG
jgi:hypothetical protein